MHDSAPLRTPPPAHAAWYALFAGGLAVWGLPSAPSPIALILGLAILMSLLANLSSLRGAWLGFLFGMAYFSLGFSWLLTSLHVYGGLSSAVSLVMLLGLSATMALYPALFGALLPRLILPSKPWLLPLAAPALWTVTEWLRAWLLGGFAWNLVGYGWNPWGHMLQVADLGGVFLLSWLMVFSGSVPVVLWWRRSEWKEILLGLIILGMVLGSVFLYGIWRMQTPLIRPSQTTQKQESQTSIRVAIVQGNIPQQLKWHASYKGKTVARYVTLSQNLPKPLDLVVWPETAMAFFLQSHPHYLSQISLLSQELQAPLLTGVPIIDLGNNGRFQYYNSMVMLDENGTLDRRYDKHHLVPFGEFIPFRAFVPTTFKKFTEGTDDFSSGPGPVPLSWHKGDIGPLICYEAIFPEEVRTLALMGVKWLINITNDAWFGDSAKPQHLAMVRLRAIENRMPVIRAANTGISAAFDSLGQELGRIMANEEGALVVTLSQGSGQSFFQGSGSFWTWVWVGLCLVSWLVVHTKSS